MNIIVLEAQAALDEFSLKDTKDKINLQLAEFLNSLSADEIKQFKDSKDFSELISSIKTLNIENIELNNFEEIKKLDDHIIESMIKRFIENA